MREWMEEGRKEGRKTHSRHVCKSTDAHPPGRLHIRLQTSRVARVLYSVCHGLIRESSHVDSQPGHPWVTRIEQYLGIRRYITYQQGNMYSISRFHSKQRMQSMYMVVLVWQSRVSICLSIYPFIYPSIYLSILQCLLHVHSAACLLSPLCYLYMPTSG